MTGRLALLLIVAIVPLFVGGFATAHPDDVLTPAAVLKPGDIIMEGQGCETSIGLSMVGPHFNDGVAQRLFGNKIGPFEVRDVQDYSGVRVVGIDGFVMVGAPGSRSTGVWHAMSRCGSYSTPSGLSGSDFGNGWVSTFIEPPAWGRDGIDTHFFVADMSFSDPALVEQVLRSTSYGLELNVAKEASIGWPEPNVMHGRLHDANHGLFEWQTPQAPAQPRADETIRFWMLVHESDAVPDSHFGLNTHGFRSGLTNAQNENRGNGEVEGRYYPIVFDVHHKGGENSVVRFPLESSGTFSHTEYCHHGHPEMEQEGGHGHSEGGTCQDGPDKFAGNSNEPFAGGQTEAGLYFSGYDTTITMGPDYSDHWFDVTWVH